ncbi:MAG: hypothetical protein HY296_06235 [Thaumarchaeota archaeon]|nr:hypothetical protein [Nitrososphaerota archaeon]
MTTVVGASPVATKNRVMLRSGEASFVRCGADIILTGLFRDVEGEARCPVCDGVIHLNIENRSIKSLEPSKALLHYVQYYVGNDQTEFGVVCENTLLFDRRECLDAWREAYTGPPSKVVTPGDFLAEVSPTRRGGGG